MRWKRQKSNGLSLHFLLLGKEPGWFLQGRVLPIKGSYVLVIELDEGRTITVGSLKAIYFPAGYYAYVGSAMSGLESRLSRHLRENKKLHWHIDYLLQRASISSIIQCENQKVECAIAQVLRCQLDFIPGFGCSDCKCPSHLFFSTEERQMKSQVMSTVKRMGIRPKLIVEPSVTA